MLLEHLPEYSILKLNRASRANALDPALLKAIRDGVKTVEKEDKRGVIITGSNLISCAYKKALRPSLVLV